MRVHSATSAGPRSSSASSSRSRALRFDFLELSAVGVDELAKGIGRSSVVVTDEASDLSHKLIQQVFCHQKARRLF